MATQMQLAREGKITDQMKIAAERERIPAEDLRRSTGNNITEPQRTVIANSLIMVGTVPIYQATVEWVSAVLPTLYFI